MGAIEEPADSQTEPVDADEGDPTALLGTEYEQAGEAYRHQASLLNRSYYLSAIVFVFFVGSVAILFAQGSRLLAALVSLLGSLSFVLIADSTYRYHERRAAAAAYRAELAERINGRAGEEVTRIQTELEEGSPSVQGILIELGLDRLYNWLYLIVLLFLLLAIFSTVSVVF